MSVLKITSENYKEEVLNSNKPVLIDFYADWCGPCRMMSPIIDEIAVQLGEKVKVGKVNVDENQDLAMEYGVMSIPTIVIRKDGEISKTFVGVRDKNEILEALKWDGVLLFHVSWQFRLKSQMLFSNRMNQANFITM